MDLLGRKAALENTFLKAKIDLLEARIEAQKDDINRLIDHNRLLANPPQYERSITPIHVSEDQEDIKYAKDTGLISIAEAEDMLRELDFDNPQAVIDDGELNNLTLF